MLETGMGDSIADKIVRKSNDLFNSNERRNCENNWRVLSEFILPNQFSNAFSADSTSLSTFSAGVKNTSRLFSSTAVQANSDLAATMHSTLTNPATQWSKLRYKDEDLNNDNDAVSWLQEVNRRLHNNLNESNFDTEISKNYKMYTSFGNMVLMHETRTKEDSEEVGVTFNALHVSEVAWEENQYREVDTLYRRFTLTPKQAQEKFANIPEEILEVARDKPNTELRFLHAIYPRDPKDVREGEVGLVPGKFRKYASCYVCMAKSNYLLEEDGYYEFPAHVVRFDTMPGERYGRGPGHIAIGAIRSLNRLEELLLQGTARATGINLLVSRRDYLQSLDLRPNSISIVGDVNGVKKLDTNPDLSVAERRIMALQQDIQKMFFLDKLLLPPRQDTGEMTATEIQIRTEQMQRVLGPTLGRLNNELLSPLIQRTFNIMMRAGALPDLPEILQERGVNVDIVFLNQLARSQQFGDITNILGFAAETAQLAQLDPNAVQRFDVDQAMKHIAKVRGLPEAVIRSDKEFQEIIQAQQEAAQAQQMLEAGIGIADIQSKMNPGGQGGAVQQ